MTRKTSKIGRPPKPGRLKRTRRLQLLLTGAEHKALNEYAARKELTASEIIRSCLRSLLEGEDSGGLKKGDTR
jgi:hypothetical protein